MEHIVLREQLASGAILSSHLEPRPHQSQAVSAVLDAFRAEDRVQIHMACGSGKTLIAAEVLRHLEPTVAIWLTPTIELMVQTEEATRNTLPHHRRILVGHRRSADRVGQIEMTNDPARLAEQVSPHSLIFSTYSSFPNLIHALELAGVGVDLIVGDEAHRTAGERGRLFSRWIEADLPEVRRLSMTATPRVVIDANGTLQPLSMIDAPAFGVVAYAYPFSRAVAEGVICDVEALIPVLEGPSTLDAQVDALISAQKEHDLKRVMSFHGSIAEARTFADALLAKGVPALHVNGSSGRAALSEARAKLAGDEPIIVTNARVFGEGIDVPALDAVFFSDFKESVVDVTQQIGRAVRKRPGKNTGFVILPPTSSDDLRETFSRGRYKKLWRVVSSIFDLTESPDLRRTRPSGVRFRVTGASDAVHRQVEETITQLLYLRRFSISEQSWMMRASEVLDYLLAGKRPYAATSPHGQWISDNGIAYREGRLSAQQAETYARIEEVLNAGRRERAARARRYVEALERGEPPVQELTILVRSNRRQAEFAGLYERMMAVRTNAELKRRARIVAFLDLYEKGEVTDRSIYAQLVAGLPDQELNDRFQKAHQRRLRQIELDRDRRRKEGITRFRAGEDAKAIAQDLGVTPSTIWFWDRQDRKGSGREKVDPQ